MEQPATEGVQMTPPASYARYRRRESLTQYMPLQEAQKHWFFPSGAARIHLALIGASGSGKSKLLAQFGYHGVKEGKAQVIIDPTGSTIDYLLDKIVRLPSAWRAQLWPRIMYIDVGASDYRVPMPLYYALGEQDTLFEIANRFPAILKRQDPDLQSAPILGWNSLYECAINAGMITAALQRQLDFMADLVLRPGSYKEELKQALAINPILAPAVEYFRELMDPSRNSLRERRTGSFISKLIPFISDPLLLTSFSSTGQGIDWEKVSREGQTVLIDLRHVHDPDIRQFSMLWYFKSFTDYIKYRGMAGRERPITLIIDELADMLAQQDSQGRSLLAQDLEELAARRARAYGVNLVLAVQSLASLAPGVQNVLMQLGTQVIGRIANNDDAETIARSLLIYDPFRLKKTENVWMSLEVFDARAPHFMGHEPTVIDTRTVEYTRDEQIAMVADSLKQLQRFDFIIRAATAEGAINHQVRQVSMAHYANDQWPDEPYLACFRKLLRQACGVPVQELLDEINQRRPAGQLEQKPPKKKADKPKEKALASDGKIDVHANTTNHPAVPRATPASRAPANGAMATHAPPAEGQDDIFG